MLAVKKYLEETGVHRVDTCDVKGRQKHQDSSQGVGARQIATFLSKEGKAVKKYLERTVHAVDSSKRCVHAADIPRPRGGQASKPIRKRRCCWCAANRNLPKQRREDQGSLSSHGITQVRSGTTLKSDLDKGEVFATHGITQEKGGTTLKKVLKTNSRRRRRMWA